METFLEIFWTYFYRAIHLKVDAWAVAISFLFLAGVSVRAYRMALLVLADMKATQANLDKQLLLLQHYRHQDIIRGLELPAEVSLYAKSLAKMSLKDTHSLEQKKHEYDITQQRLLYNKIKIHKNSINLLQENISEKSRDEFYHYMIEIKLNFPENIAKTSMEIMHLFMLTLLQRHNLAHLLDASELKEKNTERKQSLLEIEKKMIDLLNHLEKQMQTYFTNLAGERVQPAAHASISTP